MLNKNIISWNELTIDDLIFHSPLLTHFQKIGFCLIQRNSLPIQNFKIFNTYYNVQLPITFTPYAAAKPCSARCWFCSENLRFEEHQGANTIKMIEDYHLHLAQVLKEIVRIPLGLSLSGLEFSDEIDWALKTIDCLLKWQDKGGQWTEKALYSNLAGFAERQQRHILIQKLTLLNLDRLEISRHHYDENINTQIMRFRKNQIIQKNSFFIEALDNLKTHFPTKLVCILQKDGIENLNQIYQYLDWAESIGVNHVIFRELSDVSDERYIFNSTLKKIQMNKVSIENILLEIISTPQKFEWQPLHIETGYYYWNSMWSTPRIKVVFERSDYGFMKKAHDSQTIHKLIYHPNGNLCSDWTPNINILYEPQNE